MRYLACLLVLAFMGAGCDAVDGQPDPAAVYGTTPPPPPTNIPAIPPGSAYDFHSVTEPASTHYEGQGVEYDRTVKGMTGYWPTASSAGTVVGSQKPFVANIPPTPEAEITPQGVQVKAQSRGTTFTGGSSMVSIATRIWSGLSTWFWILILIVVGLVVLYFAFPAARPVISWIGRAVASIFPFIGSLVERAVGKAAVVPVQAALVQTVDGGQSFKDAIDARPDLTAAQKASIRDTFNAEMQKAQDAASTQAVKTIKATL
jgi:hypothetical protein